MFKVFNNILVVIMFLERSPPKKKILLWMHFSGGKNAKESKWTWCNAARLDHMHRNKSANSALFSLLLTPDLLLKNIVSSIALPLMMCNHTGFLHNAFSVERVYQEPQISRDILGRWWYSTSLNRKSTRRHIFTPQ